MNNKDKIEITKKIAEEIMADDIVFMEIARTSVFCHNCYPKTNKIVSMKIEKYFLNDLGDVSFQGTCEICKGKVGRYLESGENPKCLKIAKKYFNKIKI
jgi:hypothetical protein